MIQILMVLGIIAVAICVIFKSDFHGIVGTILLCTALIIQEIYKLKL